MDNFNLVVLSARAGYNFNRRLLKKKTYTHVYSCVLGRPLENTILYKFRTCTGITLN